MNGTTTLLGTVEKVTEDFGSQTAVAFGGEALLGACPGEGESYVMRWPRLPGPYEPLVVLPGRSLDVAGHPSGAAVAVAGAHGEGARPALSLTLLDLLASRRGELVRPEDGLSVGDGGVSLLWSPDGRLLALAGARAQGRPDAITLVFEVESGTPRRWMLTGHATRWEADSLVLLEEHGVSAWHPGTGTTFLGDAPARRSPDGRWSLVVTADGLEVRGPDPLERRIQLDEDQRELMGWLGPARAVLGFESPLVLDLVTLSSVRLARDGLVCRAIGPGGRVVLSDDEWLYAGTAPTHE